MNDVMIRLAEQAGFVLWSSEDVNLDQQIIDWSCNYDNEFDKYSKLLIQETIKELNLNQQFKPCE